MKRYLGAAERAFWIFDNYSRCGGIATVKIQGTLDVTRLHEALQCLQTRHPLTRVRIEEDEKGPYFTEENVSRIPVEKLTPDASVDIDDYIEEMRSKEINETFDLTKGPFLRVKLLQHPTEGLQYLFVSATHLLNDVHSGLTMTKEILELHESKPNSTDLQTNNQLIKPLELRPPLEQLFPHSFTGWQGALRSILLQVKLLCQKLATRPIRFTEDKYVDFKDRKNAFQKFEIDSKYFESILTACKEKQTTVHGFLSAIFMQAIYEDNQAREKSSSHYVSMSSAVNFREQLDPPCMHDMGSYVCLNYGFFRVKNQPTWKIAQNVTKDVMLRYLKREHISALNIGQWITPKKKDNVERALRLAEHQGPGNLAISNYGRFDFPETIGTLVINEVDMLPAISVLGNLSSGVIYTLGKVQWYFVYPSKMVDSHRVSKIMSSCRHFMDQAIVKVEINQDPQSIMTTPNTTSITTTNTTTPSTSI